MKRAHLIAKLDWIGDARLYKVVPPMTACLRPGEEPVQVEAIIVSKVRTPGTFGGPETYIFPADPHTWKTLSMREMPGSVCEEATHEQVLADLGYEVR